MPFSTPSTAACAVNGADAYHVLGAISTAHPAYRAGLRGDTGDAALDIIAGELIDESAGRYDVRTLLPALETWRVDLRVMADARLS